MTTPIFRPSARILLFDALDRLLLLKTIASGEDAGLDLWITPGGGLEPGETYEEAARRELWEETGLSGVPLGPCVWKRRHIWSWQDRLYESDERFFFARIDAHEVAPAQPTESELELIRGHRWWSVPEIGEASGMIFAPRALAIHAALLLEGAFPTNPIDVGV